VAAAIGDERGHRAVGVQVREGHGAGTVLLRAEILLAVQQQALEIRREPVAHVQRAQARRHGVIRRQPAGIRASVMVLTMLLSDEVICQPPATPLKL
jgi:hypothetical protein